METKIEKKEETKESNPMNSAGEFLYYEEKNIKDKTVEGTVLESGFSDGINAKSNG